MTAEDNDDKTEGQHSGRARLQQSLHRALGKVFPSHWSFLLGEIALISFVVLVITGGYLALFYEASSETVVYEGSYEPLRGIEMSRSYASVMDISFERPAGLLARQVHHWAALVFVAAIVLHAMRVFFTGAFRRPRRLNWAVGVTLLGTAMAAGFFGLALPHDLLGGTGTRITHAFAVSTPVIGPGLADAFFGGEFESPASLHRMWLMHVIVLPAIIGLLLAGHLALVWLQSHTQPPGGRRREDNVVGTTAVPGYAAKTVALALLVTATLVALGALVQIAPIWLYGPFEPASATVPAQPDWYLGWVEGALRILPGVDLQVGRWEIPNPFLAGVAAPALVFAVLYSWPFIEERLTGDRGSHHLLDRPRDRPLRTALGVAGLTLLAVLWAAGSHDLQGLLVQVSVDRMTDFYRVLLIAAPPLAGYVAWKICGDLRRAEDAAPAPADVPGPSGGDAP